MNETEMEYSFQIVPPARPIPSLAEDALDGLFEAPRSLPPKYFYDDRGSRLFDQICDTREYYPTRTEAALLQRHAAEIIDGVQPRHILEFGSGTSRKTRYLLDAVHGSRDSICYWPFDICSSLLHDVAKDLVDDYPSLGIRAQCGDFTAGIHHLPQPSERCLYLFLGGTIGNFDPQQAHTFLTEVSGHMQPGDALLLGADRVKDQRILHDAYNDDQGLTAAFNLNLLDVLNKELGADFDPSSFHHQARYSDERQRIEMHLVAEQAQRVHFDELGQGLELDRDEAILTEISRKFRPEDLYDMIEKAGLELEEHFEPDNGWFSLVLARKPVSYDNPGNISVL